MNCDILCGTEQCRTSEKSVNQKSVATKSDNLHGDKIVRKAFSIAEFSAMCGKHRSWGYRQVRSGRVQSIRGLGTELVPASEIERVLGMGSANGEEGQQP